MKILKPLILLFIISSIASSCFEDRDDNGIFASEINDFVWKGMNAFYLYKDEIPNLANDRFSSDEEYGTYLNTFSAPEELFESLIYQRSTIDQFSWITDDYIANDQLLNGITLTNGMNYGVSRFTPGGSDVYCIVNYVVPNKSAADEGVQRGDAFSAVDGTQLNLDNWRTLLGADVYSINLGTYDTNGTPETSDDFIASGPETVTLTKTFDPNEPEDPIYANDVLNIGGKSIGYLMYNGFNGSSADLNNVFADFKNANIGDLVIDLRYNPGGFTSKAVLLSGLITGQFTGDIMYTEQWNSELQAAFEDQNPDFLINRFISSEDGMSLNSLTLDKVYILTTGRSASASELVINALRPYIQVVQIGTNTRGKYQGSFTIYDSDNFQREGANPNHTYALQPLVFKTVNINGVTDYFNGLAPDIELRENPTFYGVLGDENEPFLAEAIANILGSGRPSIQDLDKIEFFENEFGLRNSDNGLISNKEIPENIVKRLKL
jgi:C-terminal processing protease CtpA/Prc